MTTQRAFNIVFGADLDPSLARAQREVRSQLEHQQRAAAKFYGQQQQAISQQLRAVDGGRRSLVQMTNAINRASASFEELSQEAQGLEAVGQDAGNVRRRMAELQATIDSNTQAIEELEQTDFGRRMVAEFRESQRAAERHREELERNGRAAEDLARRQARLGNLRRRGIGVGVAAGAPLIAGAAFLTQQTQEARQHRREQRQSGLSGEEYARQEFMLRQAGVFEPGDLIKETNREGSIKASEAGEEFRLAAAAIGASVEEVVRWNEEGTQLIEVLERLGRVAQIDRARVLEGFFGGTGGEQALEVDLQAFAEAAREAQGMDFANVAAARDRMLELEQALIPLTTSMTQFAGVMATGVAPVIDGLVFVMTPVANLVGNLNERFPLLTRTLGTVGVVGLGTAAALGGFLVILPSLAGGWSIATAGATAFAGSLFTVRTALITTGIGALVVGLGVALAFAADKFDLFNRAAGDMGDFTLPTFPDPNAGAASQRRETASVGGAPLVAPEGTIQVSPILGFDNCPDELKQLLTTAQAIEVNTRPTLTPAEAKDAVPVAMPQPVIRPLVDAHPGGRFGGHSGLGAAFAPSPTTREPAAPQDVNRDLAALARAAGIREPAATREPAAPPAQLGRIGLTLEAESAIRHLSNEVVRFFTEVPNRRGPEPAQSPASASPERPSPAQSPASASPDINIGSIHVAAEYGAVEIATRFGQELKKIFEDPASFDEGTA